MGVFIVVDTEFRIVIEGARGDIDQLEGMSSWKKSGWISYIARKYRQRFPVDVTFCGILVELVQGC